MSRLFRPTGKPTTKSTAIPGYKIIEPFQLETPPLQQPPPHTPMPPVHSTRDPLLPQPSPATTPIYDKQIKLASDRSEERTRRLSQTLPPRASTDDSRILNTNPGARPETLPMSALPSQAPPPIQESRTPSAPTLPPGAAQPATYGATQHGSHSNPQSPAGPQSPSQPWSNKPSPALLTKRAQPPTMNGGALPPRANGHASGNSVQYPNGRPAADSHDNGGEGSIHSEENARPGWARGFFGSSKEKEREKEAQKELTRMIGFLTATASDDWTLVLELCERASVSESAAKEAARALRQEFKYADPPAQLSAARLWAIMLQNSNNLFISQTASKKFMETVEGVILSQTTSPVVRERLIDVLAAAAFTFRKEGFQSTWRRVRPPHKPEDGIPFDTQDAMFDPTMQGHRIRTHTSPTPPQVTYVNAPQSPHVSRMAPKRQDSDQGNRPRGHRDRELPQPPRRRDRALIPPEEDMRRLFEECDVALYNSRILNEALVYATPDSFRSNSVIREYYGKSKASHAMIIAQIPWASAGAARSQERREANPGMPDVTKEEKLLASLLKANEELVDVFKCYGDLEAASQAEQERAGPKRGREERKADATQFQYTSPEGVSIPDPTQSQSQSQSQAYSGASISSREPSPSRAPGKSSNSRDLPPPPSAYAVPTQARYGHHHSQSSASINLMPPPPAPHGPRSANSHPRSRTPSPERQYAPPHQAPQSVPAVLVGAINTAAGVGFPTSSPPSSEPQHPMRHAPPPGPPPLHLHHPTARQGRIDSLRSINSVNQPGHGVAPGMRVDVGTANAYTTAADEEDIRTPPQPSEKALGKRRAPLDAEPDEEDLQIREETELEEAMLRSQSPYVNADEETPVRKVHYVYDAAAERAKELAAEEAAELAALVAARSRHSLEKPPSRMNSNQSSV